jgi:methionyl aminopeptidase
VGHGIGREMHEAPQIPNYRTRERGARLEKGMALAIEPMVNEGNYQIRLLDNDWTVVTLDGKLSAHYENTIVITENEPVILTKAC